MRPLKYPLLLFHVVCTVQHFIYNTLLVPYVFLPSSASFGAGFLSLLNIPQIVQIMIFFLFLYCTIAAVTFIFEYLSSIIVNNKCKIRSNYFRFMYYSGNVLLNFLITLHFISLYPKDQDIAKLEALELMPCPTKEFFTQPVFVLMNPHLKNTIMIYVGSILIGIALLQLLFFVLRCKRCLRCCSSGLTEINRHLYKYFRRICWTICIPTLMIVMSCAVMIIASINNQLTQGITNICLTLFGLFGLFESIGMIIFHEPYRKAMLGLFNTEHKIKALELDKNW
ncbi:unnamed protein product [Caenorhabditis brenneri]